MGEWHEQIYLGSGSTYRDENMRDISWNVTKDGNKDMLAWG